MGQEAKGLQSALQVRGVTAGIGSREAQTILGGPGNGGRGGRHLAGQLDGR